jgi:hypothetical protein
VQTAALLDSAHFVFHLSLVSGRCRGQAQRTVARMAEAEHARHEALAALHVAAAARSAVMLSPSPSIGTLAYSSSVPRVPVEFPVRHILREQPVVIPVRIREQPVVTVREWLLIRRPLCWPFAVC